MHFRSNFITAPTFAEQFVILGAILSLYKSFTAIFSRILRLILVQKGRKKIFPFPENASRKFKRLNRFAKLPGQAEDGGRRAYALRYIQKIKIYLRKPRSANVGVCGGGSMQAENNFS